jgi:peptidoglycan/xylan/chitin deacetylase (PgdA/CDA1 family)
VARPYQKRPARQRFLLLPGHRVLWSAKIFQAEDIMKIAALCMAAIAALIAGVAQAETKSFDIAITVDDLPVHGALPQGMTRVGIAQSYLATLKAHHVPEAWGFVNAIGVTHEPDSEAVLAEWRKAGYPLGNHTYSHMNLAAAPSLEAWEADTTAGEPLVAKYMPGQNWHYLRFPNLNVDPARAADAMAWLKAHHYREADVSAGFSDWAYSDAYARCLAKSDTAAIDTMKAQYLKSVDDGIVYMLATSQRVYGRTIPFVLLTHIGGFSAVMLPEVMKRLDKAGAHYVTLEKAQSDPAYQLTGGGSLIERQAALKDISLADIPAQAPTDNVVAMCK